VKRWLGPSPEKLLALVVVLVYFLQLGWPVNVFYPPGSQFSDLMLTHWPNASFMRQSVWQDGCWPLWNPNQFIGVPFAANPLGGLWYPPNWLFLILPLTPTLNLLLALHLCLGGIGMMRLLKRLEVGTVGALVAGLSWALTPKIWAHLGAGHVGLVYAAGWLPWVAYAAVQLAQSQSPGVASLVPITWALQFLADPRLAAYTAAGLAAAVIWWVLGHRQPDLSPSDRSLVWRRGWLRVQLPRWRGNRLRLMSVWLLTGVFSLGLAAIQWLPLLDYLPNTRRTALTTSQSAVYSLPPSKLIGLIWADRGGFQEWITYVGLVVLVLACLGFLTLKKRARWGLVMGFLALVFFALGEYSPLYSLLAHLPGVTLLRVPPRVWFLVSFGLVVLSGLGTDVLIPSSLSMQSSRKQVFSRHRRGLNRSAAMGLSLTGMMAVGVLFIEETLSVASVFWAAFLWLLLAIIACVISQRGKWPSWLTGGLLLLVVGLELVWMDSSLVVPRPGEELFADGQETSVYLSDRDGRVYAPSFRPAPQVSARFDLRVVNGVDPLQPADYAAFMIRATGVAMDDGVYSVTLPPLPAAGRDGDGELDVTVALADAVPSSQFLSVLDVDLVVSQFPIQSSQFTELFRHDREELTVYQSRVAVPWPVVFQRVESVSDLDAALLWLESGELMREAVVSGGPSLHGPPGYIPAEITRFTANKLEIKAFGPGLLILSELVHPGWHALVDGNPADIVPANVVLRGVYLRDGEHLVAMIFRPRAVILGAILTGLTLVAWVASCLIWRSWR